MAVGSDLGALPAGVAEGQPAVFTGERPSFLLPRSPGGRAAAVTETPSRPPSRWLARSRVAVDARGAGAQQRSGPGGAQGICSRLQRTRGGPVAAAGQRVLLTPSHRTPRRSCRKRGHTAQTAECSRKRSACSEAHAESRPCTGQAEGNRDVRAERKDPRFSSQQRVPITSLKLRLWVSSFMLLDIIKR